MIGPKRPWGPEAIRLTDEQAGRRLKERRVTDHTAKLELARFLNLPKELLEGCGTGITLGSGTLWAH